MLKLESKYKPTGDQPKAIKQLVEGIKKGLTKQTLLGVTGSGKTFTIANVIEKTQKPTLVVAHNKTLAAQLCNEFREFFPTASVEYFVSYYDYYQPEAYIARSDTYIEKEAQINDEIDRLRHTATQSLLTRRDVIIVSSVSCIYGLGSPDEYKKIILNLKLNEIVGRNNLIHKLIAMYFERTNADIDRGQFRVMGDVFEIMPKSGRSGGSESDDKSSLYRIVLENERINEIFIMDPVTRRIKERVKNLWLFPAKHYVVDSMQTSRALKSIEEELKTRLSQLKKEGKLLEYERLQRRTNFDLQMIKNLGYTSGIENYSRHFEGRKAGEPAFSLLDYFPDDFLTVIDESHVTVPQIRGMFAGDRARKDNLIEHGFRLPSARDNRPLTFEEFNKKIGDTIYVSATPAEYEVENSAQIVEQIVRPTGLLDPNILVKPVTEGKNNPSQIDDLIPRIQKRAKSNERVLVTTLTKKMAEDLTEFLEEIGIKVQYLHSDVKTFDRIEIISALRKGEYDCLVGVNLLREGLDLPEVSLVAILDADKEGFLRSETSLVQTIGRAARNVNGQVVLYADKITGSMKRALKETERRKKIQVAYNKKHKITPKTIIKEINDIRTMWRDGEKDKEIKDILAIEMTAEPHEIKKVIREKEREMKLASANLLFETAAILRDEIEVLTRELKRKQK